MFSLQSALPPNKPPSRKRPAGGLRPNIAADDPHHLAAGYLASITPPESPPVLRCWQGDIFRYDHDSGAYRILPEGEIRAELTAWTRAEFIQTNLRELAAWADQDEQKGGPPKVRKVTLQTTGNALQALRSLPGVLVPSTVEPPAWLDGVPGPDPLTLLPVRNGLLDLNAAADGRPDCLVTPTPSYFTTTAAALDYDPDAPEPREWLHFLDQLWPGDQESIDALQEWFGYLLTPDTSRQKVLFLLGPRRAGKGTIARVLRHLVGPANVAGPTLGSLAMNFGLQPLLGKSVAVVSDARLSGRTDSAVIVERLLSISGEDALTIDKKHRDPVTVRLPTRFVILSNEPLRLEDSSGALAGRLYPLRLTRSFFGIEDHGLEDRLRAELPGILRWAIGGWRRLRDRGRFVLPGSSASLVEDLEDLSSPVASFVRDCCLVGPGLQVEKEGLFRAWRRWCEARSRPPGTDLSEFGRKLLAAYPAITSSRLRVGDDRVWHYIGIALRDGDETETTS